MAKQDPPFERQVRAAFTRLHDVPYLQTHPLGGLRGKALQAALTDAVDALRSGTDAIAARTQRLLALRYVEALDSKDVAARLGVSMGEYYREHAAALAAVASLLGERLAVTPAPAPAPAAPSAARVRPPPRPIDAFVGRDREVEEVGRLLASERLVTLVGPGGVGKTRLALEVADASAGHNATWFVELAPLAEAALVAPAVGAAVGAPVSGDPTRALVESLAGQDGLLLLDNCEHLLGACAALTATLLGARPGLRVLATSREPLGVAGEVVWPLPPLEPEHAVALFALRAAAARPGFGVTPANRDAVSRICARLDGLPLGIELAAARVRALSPAEIAERLDRALDLLAAGGRGAPARHQTLRAAVEWSHDLLADEERQLFRRLSAFAGWFDLGAAEAVAGATPELLARLVDRSLVEADPRDEGTRYRLLEPLRQYAGERLAEAGEEGAFRDRHFGHYLAFAEAAEREIWGHGERASAERLEAALDNLRTALDRGLASDPTAALRLAAALWPFWRPRGHHYEGRRWLRAALERAPADAPARPNALAGASTLARDLGELDDARELAEEALRLAAEAGDHRSAGFALGTLYFIASEVDPGAGEDLSLRMLEHFRAAAFGWGVAAAFSNFGLGALRRGDFAAAQQHFAAALAESRRVGSSQSETAVLYYSAMAAYTAGELGHALALLDEADAVARATSLLGVERTFRQARGWVLLAGGDVHGAEAMFRAAVRVETPPGRARAALSQYGAPLYWLGVALLRRGDLERGTRLMAAGHPAAQQRETSGLTPGPERVEAAIEEAKSALPPERFAALWAEGQQLTSEEALAYALEESA